MRSPILIAVCVLAVRCSAQELQVWHHLAFREVDSTTGAPVTTPNGVLEPGEAALISISFSFVPNVGQAVTGYPNVLVHAFARSSLDLDNMLQTPGTWFDLRMPPGWNHSVQHAGFPTAFGGVRLIQPSQDFVEANQNNPVLDVWQGLWVPQSYDAQEARFMTWPFGSNGFRDSSKLWVRDAANPNIYGHVSAWTNIDEITIPIVPAPSAVAFTHMAAWMLIFRRQRRLDI